MRALLVHNPYSRRALKKKEIEFIVKELSVAYTTDIFETKGKGTIDEYVSLNGESYDLVIACGGDGTIHEAASGILRLQKKPKLGIIPRGTMNDVAKCHKMPKSIKKCLKIILNGHAKPHSAYRINDTFFLYGLAIGRYAGVSYSAGKKRELGRLAYYLACIKDFFYTKPTTIFIDGKEEKISQLFILNTKYLAGYSIVQTNEEFMHIKILPFKNKVSDTIRFWKFLVSKSKRHCLVLEKKMVTLDGDNLEFTLDGEKYVTSHAEIEKLKDSIEIIRN
ncbi:diacylglycerol kinase [Anaeroplasma bactoclasticum]|jgi:diacylglycerol kinase (ATP)|uniref:Diacylglycerol kinase n=1 Tax=Anaeroplasma bactoclasticum TaxID=2088 RepID=A0A397QXV4_9MOLU|nr:diacylglycerol kinase family protein [Anaeroplasma bactoclasticum]RIA64725.1 diacylglycerol kinase [Anaeroplasma bactoclasticum]